MFQIIPIANSNFFTKKAIFQITFFVIIPFAALFFIPSFSNNKNIAQKYIKNQLIITYQKLILEILEK